MAWFSSAATFFRNSTRLRRGRGRVQGVHGSYGKLTADVYRIIGAMLREKPWTVADPGVEYEVLLIAATKVTVFPWPYISNTVYLADEEEGLAPIAYAVFH